MGISLIVSFLMTGKKAVEFKDAKTINARVAHFIAYYTISALVAWSWGAIYHAFL